jgi:hypothetical protein
VVRTSVNFSRCKANLLWVAGVLAWLGLLVGAPSVRAQTSALVQARPIPMAEAKPRWQDLTPTQRQILMPLEREWQGIDAERKQKWLAIAAKYSSMLPQEQARVQERMADWARLSPAQRGLARQQFQNAKRVAPQDRPAQWEAYQALPVEQKRQLANQALVPATSSAQRDPTRAALGRGDGKGKSVQGKSNIVPNPALAVQPTPITSAVVQAQPGATTTSMAKRATPPAHQQPGLPKIAASPGFVDKATLLPKRGPQAAAIRSSAASEPLRQP